MQHPRERFHAIGTARIAELALSNVRVLLNTERQFNGREGAERLNFEPGTGLLYPCPEAEDLESLPAEHKPKSLVVLDGTWHHARTLFRDIPALHSLPRFAFKPKAPSQYRLRREPHRDFVSTIEAIVHALSALEPETPGLNTLLQTFTRMIDRQAAWPKTSRPRSLKRRREEHVRRLPRAFAEGFQNVVLTYGEAFWDPVSQAKSLVQWTAKRLATGECFESYPTAYQDVPQVFLKHMQLTGLSWQQDPEFATRWQRFVKRDDILVAWNQSIPMLLNARCPWRGSSAFLKSAYHTLYQAHGPLEDIVAQEGLEGCDNPFGGRAGSRMGNAEALARFMHARSEK